MDSKTEPKFRSFSYHPLTNMEHKKLCGLKSKKIQGRTTELPEALTLHRIRSETLRKAAPLQVNRTLIKIRAGTKWRECGMQHWSCKPTNKRMATKPNKAPRHLKIMIYIYIYISSKPPFCGVSPVFLGFGFFVSRRPIYERNEHQQNCPAPSGNWGATGPSKSDKMSLLTQKSADLIDGISD